MNMTLKSKQRRAPALCGAILSILSMAAAAQAQTATEPLSDFGFLGQGNAGITVANGLNIQFNACAPTAVDNGLTFLQNFYAAPLFSQNVNTYAAVNNLATAMGTENNNFWVYKNGVGQLGYVNANAGGAAPAYAGWTYVKTLLNVGGTSQQNIYNGTGTYLGTVNPTGGGPSVSYGQDFNPVASTLYNYLQADNAVEIGITWGTNNQAGQVVPSGSAHIS